MLMLLNSIGIELYNITFNNCNMSTIMWTSIDCWYNDSIKSKYTDFDRNNSNLAILLSVINDIFSSSISSAIFNTEITSPDTSQNRIYFHDNIIKVKSVSWGIEQSKYLHTYDNNLNIYCDEKIWNDNNEFISSNHPNKLLMKQTLFVWFA